MAKSTGLKAIAYELGVSVNTVSRALRDCKDISEHTKEIIRKKAYELGYIQSTSIFFTIVVLIIELIFILILIDLQESSAFLD